MSNLAKDLHSAFEKARTTDGVYPLATIVEGRVYVALAQQKWDEFLVAVRLLTGCAPRGDALRAYPCGTDDETVLLNGTCGSHLATAEAGQCILVL